MSSEAIVKKINEPDEENGNGFVSGRVSEDDYAEMSELSRKLGVSMSAIMRGLLHVGLEHFNKRVSRAPSEAYLELIRFGKL